MVMIGQQDYQPFGAYYSILEVFNGDPGDYRNGQPILYGSPRLHYIRCAPGVYYIRLAKDLQEQLFDIDVQGEFLCDFSLGSVDEQSLALAYLNTGDKSGLHPVVQQIVTMDEANGLDREQVLNLRAGIMSKEFLGFVPSHVFMVRPELALSDTIETEDGPIEMPRFDGGSWFHLDNPEFL